MVCTSTLDLGIDWGDVDLRHPARQPQGRLAHGPADRPRQPPAGRTVRALFVPANRFEMLECQAAREAIAENRLDGDPAAIGALDVLAQHVMGCACSEPFDLLALYDEVRSAGPYRDLAWEDFEQVVDFVSTGGYALKTYDRFRRIVKGQDGLWRVRNRPDRPAPSAERRRHRLARRAVSVRLGRPRAGTRRAQDRRGRGGLCWRCWSSATPSCSPARSGRWSASPDLDVLVSPAANKDPKMPVLGRLEVRPLHLPGPAGAPADVSTRSTGGSCPLDVREWLEVQTRPLADPRRGRDAAGDLPAAASATSWCVYPFEGRLAHTTLAMLLTRRLERLGRRPAGFRLQRLRPGRLGAEAAWTALISTSLFDEDMLGDDLEAWLAESFMMKRAFKGCAVIAGLIERRFPGQRRSPAARSPSPRT